MEDNNVTFGELLITLVFNLILAVIGFYVLQNYSMPLWGQIFVGILTFRFTLCVIKIGLAFILSFITAIVLWFYLDEETKDTELHNIHILDKKEDDDETL